ncbi:MAG: alpha/beta fold hydrolase [Dehalococcoidia bacterium]
MPIAHVNGTDLYYESHGSGFPLVFVHGGFGGLGTGPGGQRPEWVPRFAESFQVILYDRRSSGRSGFPEARHSMTQFATDRWELLRHLGHDRCHVWGTSAGGHIALEFGLTFPDAASSLIIAESAPWLTRDRHTLASLNERIAVLKEKGPDAAYAARREGGTVGLNLFAAQRPAQTPDEANAREASRAAIQAQLATVPRAERIAKYAGELRTYEAYAEFDATNRFGELQMPVLVVFGTGDTVFPDASWPELTAGKPNVTYLPVEGAEHGAATNAETLEFMLGFLRANTPTK